MNNSVFFRYDAKYYNWNKFVSKYPENADLSLVRLKPPSHDLFDLVIWHNYERGLEYNTVGSALVYPQRLDGLINKNISGDVLVVAGSDLNLSSVKGKIEILLRRFNIIYYEAKNIEMDGVHTIPMGFIPSYILINGGYAHIAKELQVHSTKKGLAGAAWGFHWKFLDRSIASRSNLDAYVETQNWVTREHWDPLEYYGKLAEFEFFFCPTGNGIQAPKLFEAWTCKTIPIVESTPAFEDLRGMGFPMVIVDSWEEVSEAYLRDILPSFYDVDWEHVHWMFSLDALRYTIQRRGAINLLQNFKNTIELAT